MEKNLPHVIEYTGEGRLSLSDIADALLAQETLVTYLPKIMEDTMPGLTVEKVRIYLKDAETGSLRKEFMIALVLAFQGDLNKEVAGGIKEMTGIEIIEKYQTVTTLLVILVALYGARFVYHKLRGKDAPPPASIQGDYNRVINITAKHLHITPDALDQAVGASVDAQAPGVIARATARFMKPAKKMDAAPIKAFDDEVISREAVQEFPVEAELLNDDRPMMPLPDVRLQILALDRQKRTTGWAATFPDKEISAARISMDLYPTVDLDELRTAEMVRADVIIEQRPGEKGRLRPARIHLVRVLEVLE